MIDYVHRRLDGKYEVGVYYQDGCERSVHDTREKAITSYKKAVYWVSGWKGSWEDVPDPEIEDKTRWPTITVDMQRTFCFGSEQMEDAIRLAMKQVSLRPGYRYEVQVALVEAEVTPPFVGEGI